MGNINWGRVILGGLLAGVVINAVEFTLHAVILDPDWKAAMAALGQPTQEDPADMMIYVGLGFLIGILAVCYYAAIRPRFGAGPKTAVCAGLGVWALAYLVPTIGMVPSGHVSQPVAMAPGGSRAGGVAPGDGGGGLALQRRLAAQASE